MRLSHLGDLPEALTMDKAGNCMIEKLMHLTLDILYLLTGEDYIVLKMSGGRVTHSSSPIISGGFGRSQSPIVEPPTHSLIHERSNDLKILELTNKIIHLLTGEEWEYLKSNKDLHRAVKEEFQQTAIFPDHYNSENLSRNSPGAVMTQKLTEDHHVAQRCAGEILERSSASNAEVVGEEIYKISDQWCTEQEMSTQMDGDGSSLRSSLQRPLGTLYPKDSFTSRPVVSPAVQCEDLAGRTIAVQACGDNEQSGNRMLEEDVVPTGWVIKDFIVPVVVEGEEPSLESTDQLMVKEEAADHGATTRGWSKESTIVPVIVGVGESSEKSVQHVGVKEEEETPGERGDHTRPPPAAVMTSGAEAGKAQQSAEWEIYEDGSTHPLAPEGPQECNWNYVSSPRTPDSKTAHGEINTFSCSECGKCFVGVSQLERHRKVHTGEELFSCSECGKKFNSFISLGLHLKSHTGEKLFACSDCGKCFTAKANLLAHQKVHTGEKSFACADCGQRFAQKSSLDAHLPVHALEKPFVCSACGKCFTTSARLALHRNTHTGEKSYECQDCGKVFTTGGSLNRHKRTHTGEKPFACMVCGKCFNRETNLYRHQMIHTR